MTPPEPVEEQRLFEVAVVRQSPVLPVNDPALVDARARAADAYGRTSAENARRVVANAIADILISPEELIDGLTHTDELVRSRAVSRLAARAPNDPRTLPAILDLLAREPEKFVRLVIAQELRVFDQQDAIAALRRAAHDEDVDVAEAASSSLAFLASPPHEAASPTAVAFRALFEADQLDQEPGTFDVILVATGPSTVQCVKVIHDITGLGIADSLRSYNGVPKLILVGVNREEAEDAMRRLAEVAATAEAVAR